MKHTPAILSLLALFSLSVTAEAGPRAREVVTICHERGYGADFMTPGNENSKTMKQVDDLFQSYSQRHIALDKEKQRSISVAHTERDTFRKHLQSLVEDICKRKKREWIATLRTWRAKRKQILASATRSKKFSRIIRIPV